ncbi:MAG: DUF2220 family protein [Terrimicrobiaceae bacterium]|nr:DUF2220 family protein [Terrimicrobiaceae bacterium]
MTPDDSCWRKFPVFREFFVQWRAARGTAEQGTHKKVFSRDWEELLRDAGLLSAVDRREAIRDVRLLESVRLLRLKTPAQRPEEILRVLLPLDAEPRLRQLFADELPQKVPAFDFGSVEWVPELAFLKAGGVNVAVEDLIKLNEFFRNGRSEIEINIKERSLQIFGDEKRLDSLRATTLLRDDRLTLRALRCYTVAEPLGWKRGPNTAGPVLVIENACTWDTYCRWNCEVAEFAGIVYGGGNRFMDSVSRLSDVFSEIGGIRRVLYFGDLDPQGLHIPKAASKVATRCGLPPVEPDLWSYAHLLTVGQQSPLGDVNDATKIEMEWIGSLTQSVREVFSRGLRIAQEGINWEWLSHQKR